MPRLRYPVLALIISLVLASPVLAQQNEGEVKLSANEIYVKIAPASTAATLIPFHIEVNGRDDDAFDVTVANADAVVSLILPSGTEINSLNAASFGYGWEVYAADSDAATSGLLISPFSRSGNHTLIGLPSTAPAGTYQIKINTTNVTTSTFVSASYITASPIKVGLLSDNASYTVGQPVVLSAFVFNGTTPITNATVEAFVMDKDHPEVQPAQVTFSDSGPDDSEPGDGIYTGVYTAGTEGKFIAALRANGNSPAGFPYVRMTSTEFRVLPPMAIFTSFSDAGVDDNGNSLFDRIVVTANLQVQQAGNYRLHLSLVANNGQEAQASATAQLATGAQQMSVSFTATQIADLGVNGPYTIKNATLFYTSDPEEPIAAFSENGGQTAAYALTSLERDAVKFTGNNSVVGIDTNSNGKFDILRIQVELNTLAAATYNWSGTLKDSAGRNIQAIDGTTAMSAGNNTLTFNFDGIKIAQNGVDGPYSLSSVLVFNDQIAVHLDELLKTQAFSVNDFECSDAPAATVQSVTLTPTSVIGGNATTLHVTLAQAAGTCGVKVTISSSNPSVIAAAIPATMIVPAGQTSADFSVITAGVSSSTQVDLTATSGISSQTATLSITPSALANLSLSFTSLQAGNPTAGKVQLDGAAPLGDKTISISSSNSSVAPVPATVTIPAGQRSVEFTINTNPSFQGNTTVTITATLGAVTRTADLTVYSETYINGSITPGGPPVTVTATEAGQNFLLAFEGSAGQRVSLKLTDVNFANDSCCGAHISIKKPDGSYLVNPVYFGTSGGFIDATSLPVAGTYTVVVDPAGANTGHATLTLYDVPADFSSTITPGGAAVTVTTTVPGQNAQLTFAGTAGQRVSLKLNSLSLSGGSGYVEFGMKNPDGSVLTSFNYVSSAGAFIDVQTLATTGTYTVFINPLDINTGNVTVTLYNVPADVTGNMTVGTPFTETTTVPGQNALLSFNGTAGQRITVNIGGVNLTAGSGYVDVILKKPDGTTLTSANYVASGGAFINTQTLPSTGVYTLFVNPQDSNTGSATFTVNDVSADITGSIIVGGNSVTVTTTSAGQNALVSFDGNAGQRVSLKITGVSLTGGNGYVDVSIKKPDGTVLTSLSYITSSGFIDVTTLPVAGTYTILVDPQGSNVGSVTLTLYDVPADTTGSITPGGSAVTVTTTVPGQNAVLTFNGSAGQKVALVLSNTTFSGCIAVTDTIKRPDGTSLISAMMCSASGFIDTVVLPVSGTYTILIDPGGATVGSQTLLLIDVPPDVSASITPGGSPVTVTTTTVGQRALATFSGTANQRVSLKVSDVGMTGGYYNYVGVTIQKPDGSSLTSSTFANSGGFIDVQTLPVTGTYTVVVDPWDTSTGSVTLTMYDVPADASLSVTPGGSSFTLTNTVPGQNGQATFVATANQRVSLNINSITLSGGYQNYVNISVKGPDGSTLVSNTYATGGTGYIDTLVLAAGTYTILVNPWDTSTGSVTLTLNDVPADATGTLTIGGPSLTLTTTVPGQNAMPIFAGTSGQQISVGFTNNSMGTVTATLLKPDGTSLTSITSSSASFGLPTQTLPVTGTYSIKIDPSGASVGSITVAVSAVISGGTLTADYQLQNTRDSSVGSAAALADIGGTNSFTSAVVDGVSTTVLTFSQGNGVSLTPTSGVVPNDTYTIVMLCSLQTTSGYRRLIDFKNAGSDNGLYVQYGHLYFYPSGYGNPVSIAANTWVQVVVTRDTTGTVTGYVDGVQQFQFSDTSSLGVISSNTLRFFRDDGGSFESSAGSVARIRLYNGALTATQVSALTRLP